MVVGFNHNFRYRGVVYHIQTEDGGLNSPNIVTLLYHGGTILASRKTSYADITKIDQLEKVVEDLMKEQHKGMLRSLKDGEFDDVIARFQANSSEKRTPGQFAEVAAASVRSKATPQARLAPKTGSEPVKPEAEAKADQQDLSPQVSPKQRQKSPTVAASLDEIVLSYLMGDEK